MLLLIRSLAPINRHHHSFALFNFYGKSFCIVHYNSMAFFKCALGRCYYVCTEAVAGHYWLYSHRTSTEDVRYFRSAVDKCCTQPEPDALRFV